MTNCIEAKAENAREVLVRALDPTAFGPLDEEFETAEGRKRRISTAETVAERVLTALDTAGYAVVDKAMMLESLAVTNRIATKLGMEIP